MQIHSLHLQRQAGAVAVGLRALFKYAYLKVFISFVICYALSQFALWPNVVVG